jgi:HNH endonuclease
MVGGTPADRFWAKVDKNGPLHPNLGTRCWIWTGFKDRKGYGQFSVDNRDVGPHRYSLQAAMGMFGDWLELRDGRRPLLQVDHRCHNRACVRPDHLRWATNKQNAENRRGARRDNRSSGIRGVYPTKSGRWYGKFRHNGKDIYTPTVDTIAEAEAAIIAARCQYFTHNDADRQESANVA